MDPLEAVGGKGLVLPVGQGEVVLLVEGPVAQQPSRRVLASRRGATKLA